MGSGWLCWCRSVPQGQAGCGTPVPSIGLGCVELRTPGGGLRAGEKVGGAVPGHRRQAGVRCWAPSSLLQGALWAGG